MIAAADGTGDLMPPDGITGQFNMADAHGQWIWHEARPGDIPVVTELGLSVDDAALARDRAFGGIVRGGTRNEANRPSLVKDPAAHESFERALADPSLPARIYPEHFSR